MIPYCPAMRVGVYHHPEIYGIAPTVTARSTRGQLRDYRRRGELGVPPLRDEPRRDARPPELPQASRAGRRAFAAGANTTPVPKNEKRAVSLTCGSWFSTMLLTPLAIWRTH